MNGVKPESCGSPRVLQIGRQVVADICTHARRDSPYECCGLLVGDRDEIVAAVAARNDRPSVDRYLINPEDHFKAIRHARAAGLTVMGAYHSHPTTLPVPSTTDLEEAHESGYLYLIVSLTEDPPRVQAFGFTGERFVPVELREV